MEKSFRIGIPQDMDPEEASELLLKALKAKEESPTSSEFDDPKVERVAKRAEKLYSDLSAEMLKEIFEVLEK